MACVDWSLNESPSVGCTGKYNNIFYGLGYSGHGVNLTSVSQNHRRSRAGRVEPWQQYHFSQRQPGLHSESAFSLDGFASRTGVGILRSLRFWFFGPDPSLRMGNALPLGWLFPIRRATDSSFRRSSGRKSGPAASGRGALRRLE